MSSPTAKRVKLITLSEEKPKQLENTNGNHPEEEEDEEGSEEEEEYDANGKPANGEPRLLFYYRKAKPKRDIFDLFQTNPHEVELDMKKYSPKDIKIKIEKLNTIIVTSKGCKKEEGEEEVPDFEHTIKLSDYYNTDLLSATLTPEKMLKISVPTIVAKRPLEREVPFLNLCEN